ncbi:hypothetical protein SAMN05421692_2352 [Chryseobacterium indologenes]|uniref:hypothetical protein n=1 Tax=Chryseobacterium indologenes TaxID=253 RepID=UPI0008E0CE57|nr:hypothetical protein [Chryseobacterium indologenes]SFJ67930.1 hypothetical protein SAMN05421692_2352 [Chryseobacterium indologenes]SUX51985.1 Uncharacterised protein [Chryseobacterium indologenes]
MKTITILEAGNLGGVVVMIIGIIILGALFFSLVVTVVAKIIYEWKGDRKFTKKTIYPDHAYMPSDLWTDQRLYLRWRILKFCLCQ